MKKILITSVVIVVVLLIQLTAVGINGYLNSDVDALGRAVTLGTRSLVGANRMYYSYKINDDVDKNDALKAAENAVKEEAGFVGTRYIDRLEVATDEKEVVGYAVSPFVYEEFTELLIDGKVISDDYTDTVPVCVGGRKYKKANLGDTLSLKIKYSNGKEFDLNCKIVGKIDPAFRLSQMNQSYDTFISQQQGVVVLPYTAAMRSDGCVASDGLFQIITSSRVDNITDIMADLPIKSQIMTDLVAGDLRAEGNAQDTRKMLSSSIILPLIFSQLLLFLAFWQQGSDSKRRLIEYAVYMAFVTLLSFVGTLIMTKWYELSTMLATWAIMEAVFLLLAAVQRLIIKQKDKKDGTKASESVLEGELL